MRGSNLKAQLLAVGGRGILALLGMTLALLGSAPPERPVQADDVLVWVNQYPVTSEQLAFVTQRLAGVSPDRLSAEQRQSMLNLLVDEELLLQRAEALGMYGADPAIRKALVQAVIDRVVAEFLASPVDPQELQRFFRQHRAVFERPMRVGVEVLRFENSLDAERAYAALLDGADFADIKYAFGAGILPYLPSSPLPAHMLRRYLGSTLADIALSLEQGEVSDPIQRSDGVYLLRTGAVTPAGVPDFYGVRAQVESEYRRRGRDKALDDTLIDLWSKADVDINPDVIRGLVVAADRRLGQLEATGSK